MAKKISKLRFIDLFAGIGGIRKGFEQACSSRGIETECVFTSEIKPHAIEILKQNHPDETISGDITKVEAQNIPDFEILLGGFPCQAFSAAGKREGFKDTRGTLFFEVERILKEKRPLGFVLENVEGLVNHDKTDKRTKIGNTLATILSHLVNLGYCVTWKVLNAKDFGVPQDRKRIYIVGSLNDFPELTRFLQSKNTLENVLERGLPVSDNAFVKKLLQYYTIQELYDMSIKDKRGGENNIHSWDLEIKGPVSNAEKELLNKIMTERRKKKWAEVYGIQWMDGMPLTIEFIKTFYDVPNLQEMLDNLVSKRYLKREYPKKINSKGKREQDSSLPLGYNIVSGKMSFEVNKVLSPYSVAPTLVAMDMQHLYVPDLNGIRKLSLREGLRLFGYPEDFKFDIPQDLGYDLLGNTVVVPVIQAVSNKLLDTLGV